MPARRIRSSSTTSSRPCARAPGCTRSTRAGRRRPNGPTSGWGSTSGRTSRSPTRSRARSSMPGSRTSGSSGAPRRASRPTARRSTRTRSTTPSARPASRPRPSASWPTPSPQADKAMICWTLGITEHHNAVDNVLALISLVLLTGHVGRYGSGVNPLRGQNNVQGGGDMGALPDRLTGLPARRERRAPRQVRRRMGRRRPAEARLAPVGDVRRDGARRPHRRLLHRREPGPVRGRPEARDRAARRASTSSSSRTCS